MMNELQHNVAFVIPTRNRLDFLTKLLRSFQEQTVKPRQIIIADGSDQPIEPALQQFSFLPITYVRAMPPSLTRQRNAGIKALNTEITLVGYLDDDIILEQDAIEEMLRFWSSCPAYIGGASFNITNNPPTKANWLTRLFYIDDGRKGKVLRSGFNTMIAPVLSDIYVEWLSGGATIWRRDILEEFKYDEWFEGWAYIEDIDFSLTVAKNKYKLVVVHSAKVQHLPPPYNPKKISLLNKILTKQRHYLVRKHPQLSVALFYWASLGQIINSFLYALVKRRWKSILSGLGVIAGLFDIIRGNFTQGDQKFRV